MNKTAMIIVDMVYDFAHPDGAIYYPQNPLLLPRIVEVLESCRKNDVLIIFIQHYHRRHIHDSELVSGRRISCIEGSGGEELMPELNVNVKKDVVIRKRRYNAFVGTDLDLVLREHGVENLIITGTKTNCCIRATVEGGYHLGYQIYIPEDCVGTNHEVTHQIHLSDINKYLGNVISRKELYAMFEKGEL